MGRLSLETPERAVRPLPGRLGEAGGRGVGTMRERVETYGCEGL